ncbi:hypothetical protein TrLO_g876 [Triparma laevis f. longispina]|uniref:Myb-like domain-containing protein n=1 Tax=Triparma laevis f. longispina TaxID=1714387 RepID=A0A9W7DLQ0_9STRA|nr:hypothetical protein TrLO_g876 [Triparma laevis f. longispina]
MQVEEAARGLASRQYMLSVTQSVKAEAIKLLNSKPSKIDKEEEIAGHKAMTVSANSRKNQKVTTSNPTPLPPGVGEEKRSVRQRVGRNYADVVRGDTIDVGGNIVFSGGGNNQFQNRNNQDRRAEQQHRQPPTKKKWIPPPSELTRNAEFNALVTKRAEILQKLGGPETGEGERGYPKEGVARLEGVPVRLPNRRKTQWDYLLEEMEWMAEDFKQERIWKNVAARGIGLSVVKEFEEKKRKSTQTSIAGDLDATIAKKKLTKAISDTVVSHWGQCGIAGPLADDGFKNWAAWAKYKNIEAKDPMEVLPLVEDSEEVMADFDEITKGLEAVQSKAGKLGAVDGELQLTKVLSKLQTVKDYGVVITGGNARTSIVSDFINSSKGKQLVICPPASVIKWRSKLGTCNLAGFPGGTYYPNAEPENEKVTLCELSAMRVSLLNVKLLEKEWECVWVDLRGEAEENIPWGWWAKIQKLKFKRRVLIEGGGKGLDARDTSAGVLQDFCCKRLAFCYPGFGKGERVFDWAKGDEADGGKVEEILKKSISPFVFTVADEDPEELPQCELIKTPLSQSQADVYNSTAHSLIGGKSTSVIANGLVKLRNICTSVYDFKNAGMVLDKGFVDTERVEGIMAKSCKMKGVKDILDGLETEEKLLVFASNPATLHLLHLLLTSLSLAHESLVSPLTPTPSSVQLSVEKFDKGDIRVLCASPTGLWGGLLPINCNVVIVDDDWSGRQMSQLHTILRKIQPPSIKRIVSADTIEEEIFSRRGGWDGFKDQGANAVVDDYGILTVGANLGKGLVDLRGMPLTNVLKCPNESDAVFLPSASDPPDAATVERENNALTGQLSVLESRACVLSTGDDGEEGVDGCVIVMPKTIQPFSASRLDMGAMPARMYVSKLAALTQPENESMDKVEEDDPVFLKRMGERWESLGVGCDDAVKLCKLLTYDGGDDGMENSNRAVANKKAQKGSFYAQAYANFIEGNQERTHCLNGKFETVMAPPAIPGVLTDGEGGAGAGGSFGMLGEGKMLSAFEAARVASKTSTSVSDYRHFGSEGKQPFLNSMLLFVKRHSSQQVKRKRGGVDIGRFIREGESGEECEIRVRAEVRRTRSQKQFKIANSLAKNSAARSHAGPGVPILFQSTTDAQKIDRCIVTIKPLKQVKGEDPMETGDVEKSRNVRQRKRLRRDNGPSKVYFGPFEGGWFNSSGGQSGIHPPRPVAGISLPMGVSLRTSERNMDSDPWTKDEDEEISNCSSRFGFNWHVSSFCASAAGRKGKRSARQCLERWQELANDSSSMSKDIKEADKEWKKIESADGDEGIQKLLWERVSEGRVGGYVVSDDENGGGGSEAVPMEVEGEGDASKSAVKKRLVALRAASTKKRQPPGIPGTDSSGQQPAPAHASHKTASTNAANSLIQSAGLKAETTQAGDLWPLQLLEAFKLKSTMNETATVPTPATAKRGASGGGGSGGAGGGGAGGGGAKPPTPKANTPPPVAVTNGGGAEVLAEMYPALTGETIQANKQKQDSVNAVALTFAMDLAENLEQWNRLAAAAGGAVRSPPTAFPQLEKQQEVERRRYEQELALYHQRKKLYEESVRQQQIREGKSPPPPPAA